MKLSSFNSHRHIGETPLYVQEILEERTNKLIDRLNNKYNPDYEFTYSKSTQSEAIYITCINEETGDSFEISLRNHKSSHSSAIKFYYNHCETWTEFKTFYLQMVEKFLSGDDPTHEDVRIFSDQIKIDKGVITL